MATGKENKLTAEGVIKAIVKQMEEDGQEFPDYIRAPAVYYVYLHKDDFQELKPYEEEIVEQARQKLDERIVELEEEAARAQRGKGLSGKLGEKLNLLIGLSESDPARRKKTYRKPQHDWSIALLRLDGRMIKPGAVTVHTQAQAAPRVKPDTGNLTQVHHGSRDTELKTAMKDYLAEPQAAEATAPKSPPQVISSTPDRIYAVIRFGDGRTSHTHEMRKPSFVIRCGDQADNADLYVRTLPELFSGELRLRYNEGDGEFYFQSSGQSGIKISGQPIPAGAAQPSGWQAEIKLSPRARINLAGVAVLDFIAY